MIWGYINGNFVPFINNHVIEAFISTVRNQVDRLKNRLVKYPNLTKLEHEAIQSFAQDRSVTIKPADKRPGFGGNVLYIWEDPCEPQIQTI